MLHETLLIFDDRFSKFRQFFFFDAVFMERFLGQDDVEQFFQFFIDVFRFTSQDVGDETVQFRDFAVRFDGHVAIHDACEHGVVRFTMRYMILCPQRIAHGMDSGAARDTESDAGPVAGQKELLHKRDARFRTVVADLQIALEDEFNGVIAENAEAGAGIRRQGRFDSMDESIDGTGCKDLERQGLQELRNEDALSA